MNIYIHEFKKSFKSLILWTFGIISIMLMFMFMFPSISSNASTMENVLNNFPDAIKKALGLTTLNFSNILDFYGYLFTYILLTGSIYAMKSGIAPLSEEIRCKTADFLLVKPVSRTKIVTAKLIQVITNLVAQNIVFILSSFLILNSFKKAPFSTKTFLLISFSLMLIQLFFVALGFLLSVTIRKIKTVFPISLGVVFFFFVLQMVNQAIDDPKLAYSTPFAYFDIPKIITTRSYNASLLIANLAFTTIFIILTYIIYNKKNIPST